MWMNMASHGQCMLIWSSSLCSQPKQLSELLQMVICLPKWLFPIHLEQDRFLGSGDAVNYVCERGFLWWLCFTISLRVRSF